MSVGPESHAPEDTDREITRRIVPPEAWNLIIKRWDHRVLVSLLAMGLRVDRAKEIAQTTWMRLIEQHRSGKLDELEFPGLALAQARFLALDELRKARAEKHRFQSLEIEPTIPDVAANAERRLLKREEVDRALIALAACAPNAQRVFRLTYEDPSMPHTEVAEKVGLSVQRVRQILCEVRKKIRLAIDGEANHD
jgi:RNA polymerase sigma-70 factor (ECF subfamily)